MPNNPVQVVLNTGDFIALPEPTQGGSIKDFYANRDHQFVMHKKRLLKELDLIRQRVEKESPAAVGYAHVVLQSEAWAKTRRPVERVLPADQVPVVGGGGLGEMLVEFTPENLNVVQDAIEQAEDTVRIAPNNKQEMVPKPSRNRGEVGAIRTIRPHLPTDRRAFSVEDAVRWLDDPRTGRLYIVETFVDLQELNLPSIHKRVRATEELRRFLDALNALELPLERLQTPSKLLGKRMLFIRLKERAGQSITQRIALHRQFLSFIEQQPAVRRVLLPPVIEPGETAQTSSGEPVLLNAPDPTTHYPVLGIVDTGIATVPTLDAWCAGRTNFVGLEGQDQAHGTFIAGLSVAASQLNTHAMFSEVPCKFFDLALFPTEAFAFESYYPRGFLDFLEQLEVEIAAAKESGVRVFNMSLALERQVAEDSYGVFAAIVDWIADTHDVLIVLPAGNLAPGYWREEWPCDAREALQMLAEYRHTGKDRLLQPAESIRAVVTGAVNPPSLSRGALLPAVYTRRGPSAALGTKPDVAHVGGRGLAAHELVSIDPFGFGVHGCGTSYAAPLVAKTLASLNELIEGHVERETLIGLLAHHSTAPPDLSVKELERVSRDFIGFGIPVPSRDMLATGDQGITLLFVGAMEEKRELVFPFTWPVSLVNPESRCRGNVRLTLAYRPPADARFDAEFVRINLDAHLQQERIDPETGEHMWKGQLSSEMDKRYERELIEHGQKWWPVKQYRRALQRVGTSSQWRLVVKGLARSGTKFPDEGVPFSVLLTIESTDPRDDVFREVRQSLLAAGIKIADVRTAARVGARV